MTTGEHKPLTDAVALLALQETPGVGRAAIGRIAALSERTGQAPGALIRLSPAALLALGMRDDDVTRLRSARTHVAAAEAALAEVREAGGEAVPHGAGRYPLALRALPGNAAPPLLCVRGAVALLDQAGAGIVGGRQPEVEAEAMARACAAALVRLGAVVVSGGARGIDTCAHEAALAAGGCTIVVLPQGLLTYRPTPALEAGFAAGRVLLLSEFAPRAPWSTPAAVTRNATISALSAMLCLFAPRRQGGSVATARWSLASGKPVGHAFADCARPLLDAAHGAFPLADPSGGLNPAALETAWSTARHPAPEPDGLF